VDNIAHTLAGIALAEAGFRRKTGLATATLAIGANLPDVDVLIYVVGSSIDALAFRRGWTHGILAMVVLPLLLAGIMLAWDRLVRRGRTGHGHRVDPRWLLAVAAIGIWSHPLLDLLNTYGVRLLMPFSGRWFYGDTLFIVDPWLWGSLAVGIVLSRIRRRRESFRPELPTRVAIAALALYVLAMTASSHIARGIVDRQAQRDPALRTMTAPRPVTPFSRDVVRDLGVAYETGRFTWDLSPLYEPGERTPVGRDAPGIFQAERTADVAAFLSWSRFPLYTTIPGRDSTVVRVTDMRYPGQPWASVEVVVPTVREVATP
jgi:inner membrane protein